MTTWSNSKIYQKQVKTVKMSKCLKIALVNLLRLYKNKNGGEYF